MIYFCNQKHSSCSPLSNGEVCVCRLQEPRRLISNASTIVAPHGAGLANLVAARPGTEVVEILSRNWFNTCYAKLAVQLGCDYRFVETRLSNATQPGEKTDPFPKVPVKTFLASTLATPSVKIATGVGTTVENSGKGAFA